MSDHYVLIEVNWPDEVIAAGTESECWDQAEIRGMLERDDNPRTGTGLVELRVGYSIVEATEPCERCDGTGIVEVSTHYRDCGSVDGEGPCSDCAGGGYVVEGLRQTKEASNGK